ncbi:MAG: carboxypeptidase-like regulatory domain-containing protein [Candidatus Acidiferrales bacterium]
MSRVCSITLLALSFVLVTPPHTRAQNASKGILSSQSGTASLKVRMRLEDDTPFTGATNLTVATPQGASLTGASTETEGEMLYSHLQPGIYIVEADAPGFAPVKQTIEVESGHSLATVFLVLKPAATPAAPKPSSPPDIARPSAVSWLPLGVDEAVPPVAPGVPCALPAVLQGAGQRVKELADNLEKFSATEHVEHFLIDTVGVRHFPDERVFDYVAVLAQAPGGMIQLYEYRDGSFDQAKFPAKISTNGLPAMAFIFHPFFAPDFNFACEGLGHLSGRPAWQIHFEQREDRPSRMRQYIVGGSSYSIPLKGRAWIDAATYQLLRLDSEQMRPIKEIGLTQDRISIEYAPVRFRTHSEQLWLPQTADVYSERLGRRYYRRHSFSGFKIFVVDTNQQIQAPKESYEFTNTSDRDVSGVLTVTPLPGKSLHPITIKFAIPPGASIYKLVGPGKDISLPVDLVGSATFVHDGPEGSIKADAYLVKESTLDVISNSSLYFSP